MSTNAQDEYLKAIGAEVLRQQLEQQQEQEERSRAANQSLRNHLIASERNQAQLQREIEAAQAKERQAKAQREKERVQAQEARAEQLEVDTKAQARQEWLQAGGHASDFEKQWKTQYLAIQQERATSREAQDKAKFMARYGGF